MMFVLLVPTIWNPVANLRPGNTGPVVTGEHSRLAGASNFVVIAIVDSVASLDQINTFAISASVLANTGAVTSRLVAAVAAVVVSVAALAHWQAFTGRVLGIAAEVSD